MTTETTADIVREVRAGMHVWFSSAAEEGFREATDVQAWTASPGTFNYDLAREWVTITYTDGHVEDRPRYGTHEIWASGPPRVVQLRS